MQAPEAVHAAPPIFRLGNVGGFSWIQIAATPQFDQNVQKFLAAARQRPGSYRYFSIQYVGSIVYADVDMTRL